MDNNYNPNNQDQSYNNGNYYNNQAYNGNGAYQSAPGFNSNQGYNSQSPMNNFNGNNGGKKKGHGGLIALVIVLCMVIAGGIGAGVTYYVSNGNAPKEEASADSSDKSSSDGSDKTADNSASSQIGQTQVIKGLADGGTSDLSGIYDEVLPSIVAITCKSTENVNTFWGTYSEDVTGAGSGVIFDKDDKYLYILTNNHVVEDAKSLSIKFVDDEVVDGEVKGTAAYSDLAVVSVKLSDLKDSTKKEVKTATLGTSADVKVGEMVMAIGNALGYGQSLTVGYVSATDREVSIEDVTLNLIQTDAAINPGNSGGALINLKGEVIGINSAKYSDKDVEGTGYAIPMDTAKPLAEQLKDSEPVSDEDRGYLGIYYKPVDDQTHQYYNIPYGLYVSQVDEKGGAAKAGIVQGDVITKVDGYSVQSANSINSIIQSKRKGDKVKVTIKRYDNGEYVEKEIEVTLAEKPAELDSDSSDSEGSRNNGNDSNNNSNPYNYYNNGNDGDSNGNSGNDGWNQFFFGY